MAYVTVVGLALVVNNDDVKLAMSMTLGGILRAERNFSLSCDFSSGDKKRQRKIPLRAQNFA
jgi:hypothetical protein